MKEYKVAVDKAYSNYSAKIAAVAEKARKEVLIPWLDENGYSFVTGMGTYLIYDPNKSTSRSVKPPMFIKKLLRIEVEDEGNPELGLWMLDHKQERY
jgi:hypothetical protein